MRILSQSTLLSCSDNSAQIELTTYFPSPF